LSFDSAVLLGISDSLMAAAAAVRTCTRLLTSAIATPVGLTTYSRHALYGLRRAPHTPSSVLIHKIADCGLLRYRGARGGRLARTKRELGLKNCLQTVRNDTIATSAGTDTALVAREEGHRRELDRRADWLQCRHRDHQRNAPEEETRRQLCSHRWLHVVPP
jgi:hypothetical protein